MAGKIKVPSELVPSQSNKIMLRSKYVYDDIKGHTQEEINAALEEQIESKVIEAGGVNWDTVPTAGSNNAVKSKDIKAALEKVIGYFVLDSNVLESTVAKTVTVADFPALAIGGSIKIKMLTKNTAANPTLRIGPASATAHPLWYNGEIASANNSWEANEIISVFFDGTNYQASNAQGGSNKKIDAYLYGDLRTLAVGQTYEENEAVKTVDKQLLRVTKEVKAMNLVDVIATGDLKTYGTGANASTYKAQKAVKVYDGTETEGLYAIGRPSLVTIIVDSSSLAIEEDTDITVTIGGVTNTITVPSAASETKDADIAALIAAAFTTIEGWALTDNEDGTLTLKCNTSGNTTISVSSNTGETGLSITSSAVNGNTTLNQYNNGSWGDVTLAAFAGDYADIGVTDNTKMWQKLNIDDLTSFATVQNTLVKEELTIERTIDLSTLQSIKYGLWGNAWHKAQVDIYSKAISVVPNQKYRVVADDMTTSFYYLAKQDIPVDKKAVTYQHITTPANQTTDITIPNGIYYLVIQDDHGQTGGNTKFPLSMELLKGVEDVVDKHKNEINDIQSSVMGVIEQYTKEDCTVVGLLQIDGSVLNNRNLSDYRTSNYIPIPEGALYIQYDGVYNPNAYTFVGLVVCDSSYNALWFNSKMGAEQHGRIYIPDVPNAAYIRFSYNIGGNPTVKFLSAAANDFSSIAGSDTLRNYGSSVYNGTYKGYTNTFLCSVDTPCLEDGIITKIRGKWISAGNAKFYIGFIDQNEYVIIRDSFTVAVGSGDNTVDVSSRNISLYKDEYLFFSGQDSIKPYFVINTSVTPTGSAATVDNKYAVRQDGVCWCFGWNVKTHKESFNELVDEIDDVKKQVQISSANIEELQNNKKYYIEDSATGINYQITVRNGNIVLVPMQFSNALVLGNSITSHGIASGVWYGVWGMAATKPEYDFVHVLEEGLQAKDINAVCDCVNIAAWEKNFSTSLATLIGNNLTSETDLVVIRLGENVPNANVSGFATALGNLVDYIYSISPNAKVVITGVFWVNSAKENQIIAAASAKGIDYIRLDYLDNPSYKEVLGHYVYGDDNQIHEITNSGVANHPNNIGMLRIANAILAAIGYGTVEKTYTLQEVTVGGVTGTMWVLN